MIDADPRSYVAASGRFDLQRLLRDFAELWRENSEVLIGTVDYREVAPQLVLMAYLHRLVDGGGFISREVGVGRKRIDLLVRWPYINRRGKRAVQRAALELKVWRDRDRKGDPLAPGLTQLDAYLAKLGLSHGVLVIFDARAEADPVEDRTRFEDTVTASGRRVTVLRLVCARWTPPNSHIARRFAISFLGASTFAMLALGSGCAVDASSSVPSAQPGSAALATSPETIQPAGDGAAGDDELIACGPGCICYADGSIDCSGVSAAE